MADRQSRSPARHAILEGYFPYQSLCMKLHVRVVRVPLPVGLALVALGTTTACTVVSVAPSPSDSVWDDAAADSASRLVAPMIDGDGALVDAGNTCQPGDVRTFQPSNYHPAAAASQGACLVSGRGDRIQQFFDACLGGAATSDACMSFRTYHPACANCIVTPDSAEHYGPLIDHHGFLAMNVAGCLELAVPGALSCAKSVQALSGCDLAACEANCRVSDTKSLADYDTCTSVADGAGCSAFAAAAGCAAALADAGSTESSRCLDADFARFYQEVVPLFCGAPTPPDAAAD
jgi:hypothetical protein